MNTPTPRTDAERERDPWPNCHEVVSAEFSRTLERELNELTAWKDSMLLAEAEWDLQAMAKQLGGHAGQSCRKVVQAAVKELLEYRSGLRHNK